MIPVKNLNILSEYLKAKSNPDKAIEYLEKTRSIKGDHWAALWIKIHRDHPELAKKHSKLNEMSKKQRPLKNTPQAASHSRVNQ